MGRMKAEEMSMNKIDGSQSTPARQLDSFQGTARSNKSESGSGIPAEGLASENGVKTGDTAEISAKALKLMEMRQVYEAGLESVEDVPDVRAEKLAQVRSRLEEGFYNSTQVREKLADGILDTFQAIDEL